MVIRPHIVSSNGSWKIGISGAIPDNWRMLVYRDWPAVHTVYLAGFPDYTSVPKMSSLSGFSIIFPGFLQVNNYFFYTSGDNLWSSAHTLGPIFIWNEPKCSKLNCRQFEYFFIKIYSTLSRNFFKKRVRAGETLAARPPSTPKKFLTANLVGRPIPYKNIQKLWF